MNKFIVFLLTVSLILAFPISIFAVEAEIEDLDLVIIKYTLDDGTKMTITQINKNNGYFKEAVANLLDYLYNSYIVKEIESINDIPLKDTMFSRYSSQTPKSLKGSGYSNSQDILHRNTENVNSSLTLIYTGEGKTPSVKVNDKIIVFHSEPYSKEGIVFVPFNSIFQAAGFNVETDFNEYYKHVIASKKVEGEELRVEVRAGGKSAYISGMGLVPMDYPPEFVNGLIYIPIQSAAMLLDGEIEYNQHNGDVSVKMVD